MVHPPGFSVECLVFHSKDVDSSLVTGAAKEGRVKTEGKTVCVCVCVHSVYYEQWEHLQIGNTFVMMYSGTHREQKVFF